MAATTYLKVLLLFTLLSMFNSCEEENIVSTDCEHLTEINAEKYQKNETTFFTISNVSINQNCLEITYSSSGCDGNTWEVSMVDANEILESFPIQRNLRFILGNEELCDAVIMKTVSFDLTPIQTENYSEIILNIDGYNGQLLYSYATIGPIENEIERKWTLVNINGGLLGANTDYPFGDIIWDFDNSKVEVQNNSSLGDNEYSGFASGSYSYFIEDDNGFKSITIDDRDLGAVSIVNEELIIDQRPVDGFQYRFQKYPN